MSRLGANDNIFAAQSTFFVELSETKKILSEATSRSLVILDELGRGTSSYDGVAVAQSVLHHVATHIGCVGFFATHYHSLATEFSGHPEIQPKTMQIQVDDENKNITFLYKLQLGVAEGSFGMVRSLRTLRLHAANHLIALCRYVWYQQAHHRPSRGSC